MQRKYFEKSCRHFFESFLDMEKLFLEAVPFHLRDVCERCFYEHPVRMSKEAKALCILQALFATLYPGFCFDKIALMAKGVARKKFLSTLLYHIFACNLPLGHLASKERLEAYLYQNIALVCSEKSFADIWQALSFSRKIKLIGFSFAFYEEGSFPLHEQARNEPYFARLLSLIETGCIPTEALWDFTTGLSKVKKADVEHFISENSAILERKAHRIKKLLSDAITSPLSDASIRGFIHFFGLYDHQVPSTCALLQESNALDDRIEACIAYLAESKKPTRERLEYLKFLQGILEHLDAFVFAPERYIEGFDHVIMALPTYGRQLDKMPYILSLARSVERFSRKLLPSAIHYPFFIFDQSEKRLFQKNGAYIALLAKKFDMQFVHLDKESILLLASIVGIEQLIVTAPHKRFGYAGARNAVFLLAPLLHFLYKKGFSIKQILAMPQTELKGAFSEAVLQPGASNAFVQMGDDDVLCDLQTIFCDALTAYRHKEKYLFRSGLLIGRNTLLVSVTITLEALLWKNHEILNQVGWTKRPMLHCMAGILSKPEICLNVPFGQEEGYVRLPHSLWWDFRRPALHLAGARYPEIMIPTNRFSGLLKWLPKLIRYVFELVQIEELLDCTNRHGRCALFWNRDFRSFKSLHDVIAAIVNPETALEVQKQFWSNVEENYRMFEDLTAREGDQQFSPTYLEELITCDIDAKLADFIAKSFGSSMFKRELAQIRKLFYVLQQEALWYKEFIKVVLHERRLQERQFAKNNELAIENAREKIEKISKKPIANHLFTSTLYTLCKKVGALGFQRAFADIF